MYAISFDLDTKLLKRHYHNSSYNNAYKDIEVFLQDYGFTRQQGSVYFGDDTVNAVTCVTAIQDLNDEYDWFEPSVIDLRMLRIEANNDLMPAIQKKIHRHRKLRVA